MNKLKRTLVIAGSYMIVFLVAMAITNAVQNRGIKSGSTTEAQNQDFPGVNIVYNGSLINELSGYVSEIDSGYLRDTVTPVDSDSMISMAVTENGQRITGFSYTLTNSTNEVVVDRGEQFTEEDGEGFRIFKFQIQKPLAAEQEYCLTIVLTNSDQQNFYYYTRIKQGTDLKTAGKLNFVLDFCKSTMDSEKSSSISAYLPSADTGEQDSFADVNLYSGSTMVNWGSLNPIIMGSISTKIKDISTDTASIVLNYKVRTTVNGVSSEYDVSEYYKIRVSDEIYYLKNYRRTMYASAASGSFEVNDKQIQLGIMQESNTQLLTCQEDPAAHAAFTIGGILYSYDLDDNVFIQIYGTEGNNYSNSNKGLMYGIKPLTITSDGDVWFLVYGYLNGQGHKGENGIVLYQYSAEDNLLSEQAYIPSDESWEVLETQIQKVAFLDQSGKLCLSLGDIIYRINFLNGQVKELAVPLDNTTCQLSQDGRILAVANAVDAREVTRIDVYYLDRQEQKVIQVDGKNLCLWGFYGDDIVYGTVDAGQIYTNSEGNIVTPMEKLYIVNEELETVREYANEGKFITNVEFQENAIYLTLVTMTADGFQEAEADFLARITEKTVSEIAIDVIYDKDKRNECYLTLPESISTEPLMMVSRKSGASDTAITIDIEFLTPKYFVYSGISAAVEYSDLTQAIEICAQQSGMVVSSSKAILWRADERSSSASTSITEIGIGNKINRVTEAICAYAEGKSSIDWNESMTMLEALEMNMDHTVVSLKGLTLDEVLYFVYRGNPVVAKLREDYYVLIVGYNPDYLQIADPETGEVSDWNYKTYGEIFASEGSVFYSYY